MRELMTEFLRFAKEQYGYSISFDNNLTPDTFKSLFGDSFIEQNTTLFDGESVEKNMSYDNSVAKIGNVNTLESQSVSLSLSISLAA